MKREGTIITPDEGKVLYCKWNNAIYDSFSLGYIYYRYGNKKLDSPYLLTEDDFEEIDPPQDNQIIIDGERYTVESMDYAYLKTYIVKLHYSNDDQIAIILNRDERGGNDEAYAEMQDWRDKAGFIARMYAGRQPLEEGK